MSYTKLDKEIEKYYKSNNMAFTYNSSTTTKEEQEKRLKEYNIIRDITVEKWKDEKKYKELISCAHGGWFSYEDFTKPLAEYFIKHNELLLLKVLCERDIRFKIEDTLKCLKRVKEDYPEITTEQMVSFNSKEYQKTNSYHPIGDLSNWRKKSLSLLNRYIELLKLTNDTDYLKMIASIHEKTSDLTIKKSDLKHIKHKLK